MLTYPDVDEFDYLGVASVSTAACGVAMVLSALLGNKIAGSVTLNKLIRETPLGTGASGLTCSQVAESAVAHGLNASVVNGMTADSIGAGVDAGKFYICLGNYAIVPASMKQNVKYMGNHFEGAYRRTPDGDFPMLDPDRLDPASSFGQNIPYTPALLDKFIATSKNPRQCVEIDGVLQPVIKATVAVKSALNLRLRPTIYAGILATVPSGGTVNIIQSVAGLPELAPDKDHQWTLVNYNLPDGQILIGYVAGEFLQLPTPPHGYDLSHNNYVPNIVGLAQNAAFLMHKATEGTYFTDPAYAGRKTAVFAAFPGYAWGAYHFGTNEDVTAQANRFLSVTKPDGTTLLALDFETDPAGHTMTLQQAADFVTAVKALTGKWPVLYTRASFIDPLDDGSAAANMDMATLRQCPLWVSNQNYPPVLPSRWSTWAINQYTQSIPAGQTVTLDTDRANVDVAAFWKANAGVETVNPSPAPQPGPPVARKRIGLHFVYEAQFAVLQTIVEKLPNKIPLITVVNHPDWANWIKQVSPQTIVISRTEIGEPSGSGGDWFNRCWGAIQNCTADYHQIANEHHAGDPGFLNSFYSGAIDAALTHGVKITVGDLASGTPEGDPAVWLPIITPMLQKAAQHGMPLCYHAYSPATPQGFVDVSAESEWFVLRYKKFQAAVPGLKVLAGEEGTGSPDFQGPDKEMALAKQMQALIDIDGAWWAVGPWSEDHGKSDITSMLNDYVQWVMEG